MFGRISRMSFRKKLLYSYFVLVILSVLIMITISSMSLMNTGRQREIERIENVFSQSLLSVDNYMKRYIKLAYVLKSDSYLTNYLNKQYTADTTTEKRFYDNFSVMQVYTSRFLYEQVNGNTITVYTDNQNLFLMGNGFVTLSNAEIWEMSWYQHTLRNKGSCLLSDTFLREGRKVLPLTLHLTPRSGYDNILQVSILVENLDNLLALPEKCQQYYLVNSDGVILASWDESLIGQHLLQAECGFLTEEFSLADGENRIVENGKMVYVMGRICRDSNLSGCYLIERTL